MQCPVTSSWYVKNGVVAPIVSDRNALNPFGIKYENGKRKGQLKKNKCLKKSDADKFLKENKNDET
jgi:hypothetical protein